MQLQYPNKILAIFKSIVDEYDEDILKNVAHVSSCSALETYIREWNDESIIQVMTYCKDWIMNAKNSRIVSVLIQSILTVVGIGRLKAMPQVMSVVSSLVCFGERHFARTNKLHEGLFLMEYVSSEATITEN